LTSSPGKPRAAIPRIAIIGRPNVGKSTLFNALLGRRRAITHARPGVTRDPVEVPASFGGARVLLVDTGGYTEGAGLDGVVSERSLRTARESDLVFLVLDAMETTPEDRDFIRVMRPLSDRIVLVVNKVDTPDRDPLVWNAHEHGFPNVVGVSAAHHRSIDRLRDLAVSLLEAQREEPLGAAASPPRRKPAAPAQPDQDTVRVAILGKPNTGKSTLANRLTDSEGSIVSPVPGTTRDVVEGSFVHKGRTFTILDTAGIRRKSRVTDPIEYYSVNRAIESISRADVVFLTIDAREGLVDQDKKIAAQAVKEGRGILIVLSKWDLMKDSPTLLEEAAERARFQFPVLGFAPVLPVSAHTGYGIRKLLDTASSVWDQLHRRISTGQLNQALEGWMEHYKLPVRGRNFKIRFMTQIGTNPLRFVAFVNRMAGFPTRYGQYLENCIRRDFSLPHVPLMLEFRQSAKTPR
jgi:GTP-binding protein